MNIFMHPPVNMVKFHEYIQYGIGDMAQSTYIQTDGSGQTKCPSAILRIGRDIMMEVEIVFSLRLKSAVETITQTI